MLWSEFSFNGSHVIAIIQLQWVTCYSQNSASMGHML